MPISRSTDTPPNHPQKTTDNTIKTLDWQIAPLIRSTQVDSTFRVTQNVMRFFKRSCGQNFAMEKEFQAWLADGTPKTLGEAADAWNEYANASTDPTPAANSEKTSDEQTER